MNIIQNGEVVYFGINISLNTNTDNQKIADFAPPIFSNRYAPDFTGSLVSMNVSYESYDKAKTFISIWEISVKLKNDQWNRKLYK